MRLIPPLVGGVVDIPGVGLRIVEAVRTPSDLVAGLGEFDARVVVDRMRSISGHDWQERYFEVDYMQDGKLRTINSSRLGK